MYRRRTIAVVMPAFNVEDRVERAVLSVPGFVDHVIVIDDGSDDGTGAVARRTGRPGLCVLRHPQNSGVGAAIATGYAEALRLGAEITAVMAGDGQMDPADLPALLDPVVDGRAEYVKGNRFRRRGVWRVMPKARLFGNVVLSLLTRLTSGYWHIFDSQCGYTAISGGALRAIGCRLFARYGYPNDLLARLGEVGARVEEVPVRAVYDGQRSGIRPWTVVYPILFVLLRSMGRRLWRQRLRPLLGARPVAPALAPQPQAPKHLLSAPPR